MKKLTFISLVLTIMFWSCGGSKEKSNDQEKASKQNMTKESIIGEWQCIDITDGVTHMESIAKMQPHLVFNEDNTISSKMKLPDGREVSQKAGKFEIRDNTIASDFFDDNPYLQDNKLIIENSSEDNKRIYKKLSN